MKKILIILTLLLVNFIHAATITTNKKVYTPTDGTPIEVEFKGMTGQNKDWIAIYPAGTDNSWKNVIRWKWTGDKSAGKITLVAANQRFKIKNGKYEARAFYNNSYKLEAKVAFEIKGENPRAPKLNLPKTKYSTTENITVDFKNMINANQDWIAIYPLEANNAWENVIDWAWTDDKTSGQLTFDALPEGNYEIRAFYNNSASVVYARIAFKVSNTSPKLYLQSESFSSQEKVALSFADMSNKNKDWIGIYPASANNSWSNVLAWAWTGDVKYGRIIFKNTPLPKGNYEARAFYNNSFKTETKVAFTVYDEEEKIISLAQNCLNDDSTTASVLCSNNLEKAYIIPRPRIIDGNRERTYQAHYEVTLSNNKIKIIEEQTMEPFQQQDFESLGSFYKKFTTSPIYITKTFAQNTADEHGNYHFYSNNQRVLSIYWYEASDYIVKESLKILDNGTKLYMERNYRNAEEKHKETYDISNPNQMTLISREIEYLPYL